MFRRPTRRPRYADVAATLALVVALGGTTAYAVQQIPKHSVGKKQLARDAVTSKKIKNGKVKAQDLAIGSVSTGTIANGQVTGADLAAGSVGVGQLGTGAVGTAKLADGAVTAAKVANDSIGLGKLVGADVVTTVSYPAINAGECQADSVTVAGAQVGQVALMSFLGAGAASFPKLTLSPLVVTLPGQVEYLLCNPTTATNVAAGQIAARVITFG